LATPLARLEGKFEILEKIREGGMGSVYKVRHRLLDELRVVKVMRPHLADDEVLRARFLREAKVAIKLRHPNLAQIYDFTVDDNGYAYLVMEFIDGLNLQDVIKVLGRPSPGLVSEISRQSLAALGYLHRKRIIHRDVSPDNLLVTRDDESRLQVKLIDLGIAKVGGGEDSLTSAGTFLGKVRYSSPEHFRTHEGPDISAASDLYSFGVVLYEMLTGVYPIKGTSVAALISGHLVHPPLDFAESDPEAKISDDLRAVILKSLAKNPEDRFESAAEFSEALISLLGTEPPTKDELSAIFDLPTVTTHKIRTVKPGSTQSRMDRSFGLSETPAPGADSSGGTELETSGTIETGGGTRQQVTQKDGALKSQIRALLQGAGKLVEGKHFSEARMQLAAVFELDSDNSDARVLMDAIEAADVELKNRRQEVVDSVRLLVRARSFDQALTQLDKAIKNLGSSESFNAARDEINAAKQRHETRIARVQELTTKAVALIGDEDYENAIPLLREGLDFEPTNRDLIARLEEAENGLEAKIEARRREHEIEKTAATVSAHIESRDVDEAARALAVARKVYGGESVFVDLAGRLEQLRDELHLEHLAALREDARRRIEEREYSAAIDILEEAERQAPAAKETSDLLAAARKGLRLEEEALRRLAAIDKAVVRIEHLIVAGRLESALRAIDATVDEHGDFEEAESLRNDAQNQRAARDEAETKARSAIKRALELAGGDSFADADGELDSLRAIQTEHPEIGELVADAETEVKRRLEAHRRKLAIGSVSSSIEKQLKKSAIDEAHRELAVARRLYGNSHALDELGSKIDARAHELRHDRITELVKSARRKQRPVDEAITDLESALEFDPDNEDVHRLLTEARAAKKRSDEERLEDENWDSLARVDELIADGMLDEAIATLDTIIEAAGDFRAARVLRHRLQRLLGKVS
jgi:serine/threonine protein kinase